MESVENNIGKKEVYNLTSLRFIAAFYVFIFHCHIHFGAITSIDVVNKIISQGQIAMSLFFVLSGYILALSYKNINLKNIKIYYINRIARIYPTYIVYGLIGLFFLFNNFEYIQNMSHIQIDSTKVIQVILLMIAFIFMFQAWFPSMFSIWNFGGSWSLSVEAFFYSIYPVIRFLVNNSSKNLLYGILMLSYIWASLPAVYLNFFGKAISVQLMGTYVYVSPIFRLGEFVFGVLCYVIFVEHKKVLIHRIKLYLLILFIIFVYALLNLNSLIGLTALNFISIPMVGLLIYYLHSTKNIVLENKIFVYLGHISYSFYLAQFAVFAALKEKINKMGGQDMIEIKWLIGLLITLTIAIVLYHLVELPARKYLRKRNREKLL